MISFVPKREGKGFSLELKVGHYFSETVARGGTNSREFRGLISGDF